MTFAEKIKSYRKDAGLTQEKVSEIIGVKRSAYAYYEIGKSTPKFPVLMKLAAMYNTTTDELLDVEEVKSVAQKSTAQEWSTTDDFSDLSPFEKMVVMKTRLMSKKEKDALAEYLGK